ncbi:TetR/AcrR family transcriptional regulator [Portibacter marinus]|uniref:TetR/AcrR family transcriptional regulator n=1 Tax=Portibacter marinus TaxID=2898660 RepID=UPI001F475E08|nr:TetR/AcrR family transcriptional regulator [Portibacter marinus]
MICGIKFEMNNSLFIRDPQDTDLGKKILQYSILLIDEIGFEAFTFKKLAHRIDSVEKSIYRYFENKHYLLLFLTSWYWEWVYYLINVNVKNIEDPRNRLQVAIKKMVHATSENVDTQYINENVLHKLVINESAKAYHTFHVDTENQAGLFWSYKKLIIMISEIICEIDPDFPYAKSLASNLFEMSNTQIYFAQHLPRLTSLHSDPVDDNELIEMLSFFAEKLLRKA